MITIYKIRNKETGRYSHGRFIKTWADTTYRIGKWSSKGKEWATEKAVKDHLMKAIEYGGIPANWEIMEFTQQPSKELNDWVDSKMLVKMLKVNHSK